jgi:hypothetical protein
MSLIKRYKFYKTSLQFLFATNLFLIAWGFVALTGYLQTNDVAFSELAFVGMATLLFGIVLPGYLIYRAEQKMQAVRNHVQQSLAKLVGVWAENYKNFHGEVYQNPVFWTNMALLAVEEFGQDSDHPFMKVFLEFSPYVRKEITRQTKTSKSSRAA